MLLGTFSMLLLVLEEAPVLQATAMEPTESQSHCCDPPGNFHSWDMIDGCASNTDDVTSADQKEMCLLHSTPVRSLLRSRCICRNIA